MVGNGGDLIKREDTFYRTELSFFIPKLRLNEIYGVSRNYRDLTMRNIMLIFSIEKL